MRWAILLGILGLAIGFLIGRAQDDQGAPDQEGAPVARSARKVSGRSGASAIRRPTESKKREGERMVAEVAGLEGSFSEISQARLMKWIMELEAGDFPEILQELEKLGDPKYADPFSNASPNADFLTVAMGRWYELEGEAVLEWILTKPEVLKKRETASLLQELLQDGYSRDSGQTIQLLKKYHGAMGDDDTVGGVANSWFYLLGKSSRNLMVEFEELRELSLTWDDPDGDFQNPDPFAREEPPQQLLVRGAIVAGREEELRLMFEGKDPEFIELLDRAVNFEKVKEIESQGWASLKDSIDRGEIESESWMSRRIIASWSKDEPEKAYEWFLSQQWNDREEQLKFAVFSPLLKWNEDPFDYNFQLPAAVQRVKDLETRGEPAEAVNEVWREVLDRVMNRRQWDDLEKLQADVDPGLWADAMEQVSRGQVRSSKLGFPVPSSVPGVEQSDQIQFQQLTGSSEVLERFGLKERTMQAIAENNEKALRELQRRLGVEE